jgi:hyperosmotically inducible periplasmic protein
MKNKLAATCFAIGTLLVPFAIHAADTNTDTDRTHPKTFVKDSVITTKVKAKLAEEKVSSLAHIKVDTHGKGAVVLRGTARSQEEADKAVSIARDTEGVTSVKSKIRIKKDD